MLVAAKILNVQVPFFFKEAVDCLNANTGEMLTFSDPIAAVSSSAFALIVACKKITIYIIPYIDA